MAVTLGKSPIIMTAAADAIGGPTALPQNGREWKVVQIRIVNGSGAGTTTLLDKVGGQKIFETVALGANLADGTQWAYPVTMDGIYVSALPSGATVYIYYC